MLLSPRPTTDHPLNGTQPSREDAYNVHTVLRPDRSGQQPKAGANRLDKASEALGGLAIVSPVEAGRIKRPVDER
jgi:hypothetical protein